MAENIPFIPKRKMLAALGDPGIADVINHVTQITTAPGTTPSGETVGYWHVTKEMKIPVGTDMYR